MTRCEADHFVFFLHSSSGLCIYLVIYVDDIGITGDDSDRIHWLKSHLQSQFQMKDLDPLKYFLGIEVAQSTSCIAISQRKYVLGILIEIGMLNCRPCDTAMDSNIKLLLGLGESLEDLEKYHRLVGGLNYLIVTRSNITFAISVVSQFLNASCDSHWHVVMCILQYIKNASGCRLL